MTSAPGAAIGPRVSGPRAVAILAMLAALTALAPFSVDVYTPSLPALEADLGAADWLAQLSVTGCLLGIGIGQFLWGPLSDRVGRRPVILGGVVGWAVASAASALVVDGVTLVAARVLAGLCGAACIVAARSVVRDITPDVHAMAARIGMLSMVSAAGPIVAPVAGAAIAEAWGWRADFVALTALGVVLSLAFWLIVPETHPAETRRRDGLGIVAGLRAAFRDRALLGVTLALAAFAFGFYAYVATASFVVEREFGYPPLVFALVFGTNALVMVGANLLFRRLVRRWRPRPLLGAGLALSVLAGAILLAAALLSAPGWMLWLASMLFAVSAGFVLPGAHSAGQATAVASGAASALTGAAQFLGGVVGSPVTGMLGTDAVTLGAVILAASALGVVVWRWIRPRRDTVSVI